jgi:dolichol-phosphate mannosyltransferase
VIGLLAALAFVQACLGVRGLARFVATAGGERVVPSASPSAERISVLLPVLDEERRVGACLEGAIAQPEEVAEILVVDGGSRDRTREVVEGYTSRDSRVRFVDASPVPETWTGKAWGLHVGLERAAAHEWVLCLDADVRARAGLARSLLDHARRSGARAFSVAARQRLSGSLEALIHPALLATLVYRFGAPGGATRDPSRVQANGQCFLARRELLMRTRAFAAARRSLCEDITIVRHLAAGGEAVGFYEAEDLVEVEMYETWRETWRNWPRSLPMRDHFFGWREVLGLVEVGAVQALPAPLLALAWTLGGPPWLLAVEGALAACRLGVLAGTARAYVDPPASYWLSPLADVPAALRMARCALQRRHVWRGRAYVRRSDGGFQPEGGVQ